MNMSELKVNVLVTMGIGAIVVIGLAIVLPGQPELVFGLAGTLIGGLCAVLRDLLAPPDPPPSVPQAAVTEMIAALKERGK